MITLNLIFLLIVGLELSLSNADSNACEHITISSMQHVNSVLHCNEVASLTLDWKESNINMQLVFPALKIIRGDLRLEISEGTFSAIRFPILSTIEDDISVLVDTDARLELLDLPLLQVVADNIYFQDPSWRYDDDDVLGIVRLATGLPASESLRIGGQIVIDTPLELDLGRVTWIGSGQDEFAIEMSLSSMTSAIIKLNTKCADCQLVIVGGVFIELDNDAKADVAIQGLASILAHKSGPAVYVYLDDDGELMTLNMTSSQLKPDWSFPFLTLGEVNVNLRDDSRLGTLELNGFASIHDLDISIKQDAKIRHLVMSHQEIDDVDEVSECHFRGIKESYRSRCSCFSPGLSDDCDTYSGTLKLVGFPFEADMKLKSSSSSSSSSSTWFETETISIIIDDDEIDGKLYLESIEVSDTDSTVWMLLFIPDQNNKQAFPWTPWWWNHDHERNGDERRGVNPEEDSDPDVQLSETSHRIARRSEWNRDPTAQCLYVSLPVSNDLPMPPTSGWHWVAQEGCPDTITINSELFNDPLNGAFVVDGDVDVPSSPTTTSSPSDTTSTTSTTTAAETTVSEMASTSTSISQATTSARATTTQTSSTALPITLTTDSDTTMSVETTTTMETATTTTMETTTTQDSTTQSISSSVPASTTDNAVKPATTTETPHEETTTISESESTPSTTITDTTSTSTSSSSPYGDGSATSSSFGSSIGIGFAAAIVVILMLVIMAFFGVKRRKTSSSVQIFTPATNNNFDDDDFNEPVNVLLFSKNEMFNMNLANPDETLDEHGFHALHYAIGTGDYNQIQVLLGQPDSETIVNLPDAWGCTPLLWAVNLLDMHSLKILLEAGARVDDVMEGQQSALHLAVSASSSTKSKGLPVDSQQAIIVCLLQAGADINSRNMEGQTPLYLACLYGNHKIVDILITYNADISIPDVHGSCCMSAAIRQSFPLVVARLLKADVAPIYKLDDSGMNGLHWATACNEVNCLQLLLSSDKVDVMKQASNQRGNALHIAAREQNFEAALVFVNKLPPQRLLSMLVDKIPDSEMTPALLASNLGFDDMYRLLYDAEQDCRRVLSSEMSKLMYGGQSDGHASSPNADSPYSTTSPSSEETGQELSESEAKTKRKQRDRRDYMKQRRMKRKQENEEKQREVDLLARQNKILESHIKALSEQVMLLREMAMDNSDTDL